MKRYSNGIRPRPVIRDLLCERSETVSEFAYSIGISFSHASRIARGWIRPKDEGVIRRIVEHFGLPESDLFPEARQGRQA